MFDLNDIYDRVDGLRCKVNEQQAEIERLRADNEVLSVTLDGLYEQRDECRRLLRELLDEVELECGWLPEWHETDEWVKAARKAAGGNDGTH